MKVTVVHNEDAGHGAIGRRELTRWIEQAGHQPTYCSTDDDEALAAALREPGDLVVVAGGDGSVRSVSRALLGRSIPLTILPMGTANNVASHLGLGGDLEALVRQWAGGRLQSFDVGTVEGPWGSNIFFEACGFGALARTIAALTPVVAPTTEDGTPDNELARDLEVTRELLADHPAYAVEIQTDGAHVARDVIVVEVMNIRSLGANIALAPDADASDGWLDLVLIGEDGRCALRHYLTAKLESLRDNGHGTSWHLELPIRRARQVIVRWSGSRIHVDDEIVPDEEAASTARYWPDGVCELTFGIMPGALTMLCPADTHARDSTSWRGRSSASVV